MSGLCGVVEFSGRPVDRQLLSRMASASPYRAPDGIRTWVGGRAGFAHLALHSTSEEERERQPLAVRGGKLCLVADARLDNRKLLIAQLFGDPAPQPAPTDAEIILAAFLQWGDDCPRLLVGDFAFAIWDETKGRLFCARDALGVRRLHYARVSSVLCIASDAQQVLVHPEIPRRLDEVALARYLTRDLSDEEGTMFLDVKRLPPAHTLVADSDGVHLERYWDIQPGKSILYKRSEEYADHFGEVFRRSVERRMRTQAPALAIEMSGGVDSCSVAALARDLFERDQVGARPFALSFAFDLLPECDERRYSSLMARDGSLDVEYLGLEDYWLLGDRRAYEPPLETPFMAWDSGQGRLAERAWEKGARVVLSGQSGDGVVLGSPYVLSDQVRSGRLLSAVGNFLAESRTRRESIASMAYRRVLRPLMPLWVDRTLRVMVGAPSDRDIPQWIDPMLAKRTGLATRLADRGGSPTFRQAAKRHQYRTAVSRSGASWWGYLYDRAMGSHGIEARHPFLDRDLVEYVLALPAQELFQAGTTKPLLRRSMRGILPEEIRLRTDKTSSLPFTAYSLRDKEGRHVTELFERSVLAEMGFVDGARVRDLCRNYVAGTTGNDIEMWMLVTAERWLRAHWR